jgi:hypothetical protein
LLLLLLLLLLLSIYLYLNLIFQGFSSRLYTFQYSRQSGLPW